MVVVTGSVTHLLLVSQEACGPSAANGVTCKTHTHTHSGKRLATAVMRRNYNVLCVTRDFMRNIENFNCVFLNTTTTPSYPIFRAQRQVFLLILTENSTQPLYCERIRRRASHHSQWCAACHTVQSGPQTLQSGKKGRGSRTGRQVVHPPCSLRNSTSSLAPSAADDTLCIFRSVTRLSVAVRCRDTVIHRPQTHPTSARDEGVNCCLGQQPEVILCACAKSGFENHVTVTQA